MIVIEQNNMNVSFQIMKQIYCNINSVLLMILKETQIAVAKWLLSSFVEFRWPLPSYPEIYMNLRRSVKVFTLCGSLPLMAMSLWAYNISVEFIYCTCLAPNQSEGLLDACRSKLNYIFKAFLDHKNGEINPSLTVRWSHEFNLMKFLKLF